MTAPVAPPARQRRWVLNLAALGALPVATVVGSMVVPWDLVFGSWFQDGYELMGLVYALIGLGAGAAVWLVAWAFTWAGPRRIWAGVLITAVATPVLVINAFALVAARDNTCRIRAANGHDERLHDLPWPLGPSCPFNEKYAVVNDVRIEVTPPPSAATK